MSNDRSDSQLLSGKYVLSAKDFQEILNYISKRPLGEVINVFGALQRSNFVPDAPVKTEETQAPQT